MDKSKRCPTCKFYLLDGSAIYCRRYPPTPFLVPQPSGQPASLSVFPGVNDQMVCGEYQRELVVLPTNSDIANVQ